ncbi:MAG: extracellular solute-binding protein [Cyanobacteria bacterium NC_groundwater_1444_Ag_S-0.65um_54_12]|nr:extracellular solute-binding protein [Cyanobacteria bacterium NC_groundwater_1444_Ag_S-0.65um_54_12]
MSGALSCSNLPASSALTVWHSWGGAELATLKQLLKRYRKIHPDVEVLALQIPHDRLLDKFIRSSAANGGPDLLIGDNDWSGKLAQSGLLATIFDETTAALSKGPTDATIAAEVVTRDPQAALFPIADEQLFAPETLAALRVDQKIYAWPESLETVALYYNRQIIAKPPATVPDMLRLTAQTHVPEGSALVFNTAFYFSAGYFLGGGGTIFQPGGNSTVNTPAGQQMLAWLARLKSSPGVLATNDYGKADSLYKQGKAGMIVNGPWALADYQQALGPNMGVAPLPRLADGRPARPWIGVKTLMVNANADAVHRRLAVDFCRFVTEPAIQLALSAGCGHIPAVQGIELPADSPLRAFQHQARTGIPKGADPLLAVIWEPLDRAIQEVINGGKEPAVALARAEAAISAKIAAVRANLQ